MSLKVGQKVEVQWDDSNPQVNGKQGVIVKVVTESSPNWVDVEIEGGNLSVKRIRTDTSWKNTPMKLSKRMRRQQAIEKEQKLYRMCFKKKKYDTQIEALAYGKISNDINNQNRNFRAYFCPHCQNFHLTSQKAHRSQITA